MRKLVTRIGTNVAEVAGEFDLLSWRDTLVAKQQDGGIYPGVIEHF
jgi:hypothetical protein